MVNFRWLSFIPEPLRMFLIYTLLAMFPFIQGCAIGERTTGSPNGVQPTAVTASLRAELVRQLSLRGIELDPQGAPSKVVSQVPRRDYLTPNRAIVMGNAILGWRHKMMGDYDQNGEVNISDLQPIAAHFNKTSASPDWDNAQAADGDGNGEINAQDITPIAQNFGAVCDGYVVDARYGINGSWREFGYVPFSSATRIGVFKELGYTAVEGAAENDFRVAPVAATREFEWTLYPLDTGSGSFDNAAICTVGGLPAVAFVDTNNDILYYAYSSVTHPLQAAEWTIVKADYQQPDRISTPSIVEIGGLPAIAYFDSLGDYPKGGTFYCRAKSTIPRSRELVPDDWVSYQIDQCDSNSNNPALIERDGLPVLFYGDHQNSLRMAMANKASPDSTDWIIIDAYKSSTWPLGPSPAFIAGQPVIAFSNLNYSSTIAFCRAINLNPTGPGDFLAYDFPQIIDGYSDLPSLTVAGNLPCFVCTNYPPLELYFRHAVASFPAIEDWQEYTLFASLDEILYLFLSKLDGKPALSFQVESTQKFYWAKGEQPGAYSEWLSASIPGQEFNHRAAFTAIEGTPIMVLKHWVDDDNQQIMIAMAQEK
jgi:hypothetical protein